MKSALVFVFLFYAGGKVPVGTVRVGGYYVGKTEILNIHWLEYLHYRSQELDSSQIVSLQPDPSNTWYRSPAERFKPIVLITQSQAQDYCRWLSQIVSQRTGEKVTYRLPTPPEWQEIATELLKTGSKEADRELRATRKLIEKATGRYTMVDRRDTKEMVYDLFQNVSEMTSESGVAMGANNGDLAELHANPTRQIKYTSPNSYIGFRCIAAFD